VLEWVSRVHFSAKAFPIIFNQDLPEKFQSGCAEKFSITA
jgi:hypothetical protein